MQLCGVLCVLPLPWPRVAGTREEGRGDRVHIERAFLLVDRESGARKAGTKPVHLCFGERGNSCDFKPWTTQHEGGRERRELPGENRVHEQFNFLL